MGNWSLLNSKGRSDDIIGIRGMKTSSPFVAPVIMVAWMMWDISSLTTSRVPLQSLGGSKFLRCMMGTPTFSSNLWGGIPGNAHIAVLYRFVEILVPSKTQNSSFLMTKITTLTTWPPVCHLRKEYDRSDERSDQLFQSTKICHWLQRMALVYTGGHVLWITTMREKKFNLSSNQARV